MKRRLLLALTFSFLILPIAVYGQDQRPPRLTTVTENRYRLQPGDVIEATSLHAELISHHQGARRLHLA
jgi:hypothetical protein